MQLMTPSWCLKATRDKMSSSASFLASKPYTASHSLDVMFCSSLKVVGLFCWSIEVSKEESNCSINQFKNWIITFVYKCINNIKDTKVYNNALEIKRVKNVHITFLFVSVKNGKKSYFTLNFFQCCFNDYKYSVKKTQSI